MPKHKNTLGSLTQLVSRTSELIVLEANVSIGRNNVVFVHVTLNPVDY